MNKPRRDIKPPPMPPCAPSSTGHWLAPASGEWRPIPTFSSGQKAEGRRQSTVETLLLSAFRLPPSDPAPVEAYDEWGQGWRSGYHER